MDTVAELRFAAGEEVAPSGLAEFGTGSAPARIGCFDTGVLDGDEFVESWLTYEKSALTPLAMRGRSDAAFNQDLDTLAEASLAARYDGANDALSIALETTGPGV